MISYSNSIVTAAVLLAVASRGSCQCQNSTRTVAISATIPFGASQKVDPSFPGFAFEQASFYNYSFDAQGNPNVFSQNLVNAVLNRTGGTPLLRVGGTSGDSGNFSSSQQTPTNFPADQFGPQFKGGVTLGPSYFDAFKNWPGAKFEFMVPFKNTSHSHTLKWAATGVDAIGIDNLYTLEIGNEPTFYPWFSKTNNTAGIETYAKRYLSLQDQLKQQIPALDDKRIFQALDTAANAATKLKAKPAFEMGLNAVATSIRQVGFHYYQGHPGPRTFAELQGWIRHSVTVENMTNFTPNIRYLRNNHPAIGFAFTETGYNVGGGGGGLGNNLASALWAVDFQLYGMTANVSRVNWQQILRGSLHMWRAVEADGLPPAVTPNYYSQPFVADFIGRSGQTQVAPIDVDDDADGTLVAYGAYESGKLVRVAVLNVDLWTPQNCTTRPHVGFTLEGLPNTTTQVQVHHLTAPDGALAEDGLTYAGLQWTYENNGVEKQVGKDSNVLNVNGGVVKFPVRSSSAVMIVL
ncbi:hypothetical protein F4821DRAFT_249878 [Hypoxylon rubiginosum]|uniref:Uncharacterized protein n=1 Tax=Hypoxylon rubiginosum TaxID=110542 RepID=A0ACC0CLH4_9PEZI|nr:hypothetical protein F4821DRAFT_249878 [Hypoxylon rubiginosum]